jgi:hypothetical protein
MFIDHLEIIKEKTRGNLNSDEEKILTSVLSELQLAFVQVAQGGAVSGHVHDENCDHGDHSHDDHTEASAPDAVVQPESQKADPSSTDEGEGKKKFTKSYGA